MDLIEWFKDRRKNGRLSKEERQREIADGLWTKCVSCAALHYTKDFQLNLCVCPACGHHERVGAPERIPQLVDPDSWVSTDDHLLANDPLGFNDIKSYPERLAQAREKTGLSDAIVTGLATLEGRPIALGVMDFRFMGGSMGSVVGERITRLVERATAERRAAILVCASGGARMQEGVLSLVQMARTSAALQNHRSDRQLFVSVLTNPTTGGVTASFAMLGDIILAEPKATIGFAGRRVIEQTLRQKLPEGFQTAEFLLKHGFVDRIVERAQLRPTLARILRLHGVGQVQAYRPSPQASLAQEQQ
ncbi:acetyl-CoA carboxylase, carboxyltransferase subunit beta [Gloeobacter violaceus]|uniref:Acetyl-coenzyme A carboxylase carboxyl transferase subunit beta n=1 Tax=Gloeobacter violaceus (strain ATCC 29082 / PCC 7421) TaxID=251221 RepID=ACCD_GLOVI|nr:acetyl-CoA carboxylase, carboxyltransferase subunit beta [Gloeobacter violaceus]Q7NK73.1 RecName: Full=Acetyl-coenzyme A carboxylase carboxyl transferase subunit beta; Short=ACCase subunit beta; Short=Acetyl-CoA carboxylase carboxyltransferase subunit beta [Gloeobacter violaceus PCC 7421]BAC89546.1 acetyl-CoA carboxylase beta subunit [Gloeobacter violaceus PCC 7421]